MSYHEARLSELGLDRVADRVEFFQGDATNLKPQFTGYDLILAANLIDRLNDPKKFLETVHERLNPGGVLVITSPYTWLEEFTKKENWLGGYSQSGRTLPDAGRPARPAESPFRHAGRAAGHGIRDSRNAAEVPTHGRRTHGLEAGAMIVQGEGAHDDTSRACRPVAGRVVGDVRWRCAGHACPLVLRRGGLAAGLSAPSATIRRRASTTPIPSCRWPARGPPAVAPKRAKWSAVSFSTVRCAQNAGRRRDCCRTPYHKSGLWCARPPSRWDSQRRKWSSR